MAAESFINDGHVLYFEPTDIDRGKDQDGNSVSLMPQFEDFCIAMTLTAEIYPREKESIETIDNSQKAPINTKSLSWVSYASDIQNRDYKSQQIVNGGFSVGEENFLTTYYTEISADKYIENEIVEGLGVTSVNISYANWYTPTITINFIDVHGSSLWGREEAIHDNGDNLTSNNVLGVFFTLPYPLFRLQVKGFLGHDVTYQLTVSSFKGKYNANTGNFEVTATFIGYSYSLLTDIPIQYLAYVSEMSYVGRQYWDDHVNTSSWQMVNADGSRTPPIPLYKLIQSIKSASEAITTKNSRNCDGSKADEREADRNNGDVTAEDNEISVSAAQIVSDAINSDNDLEGVATALTNFEKAISACSEGSFYGQEGKSKQLLLLVNVDSSGKFTLNEACHTAYVNLCNSIEAYNKKYPNNKITNGIESSNKSLHDKLSSETSSDWKVDGYTILRTYFENYTWGDTGMNTMKFKVTPSGNVLEYKNIKFGKTNCKLYQDTANKLETFCNAYNRGETPYQFPTDMMNNVYGYLLPLGEMWSNISSLRELYSKASINIQNEAETNAASKSNSSEPVKKTNKYKKKTKTDKKKIIDMIGFEPTIGNFTKLVMCHLETFVEVMMHCGEQIYRQATQGKRTYDYLNLTKDGTDIANSETVWPWPALYNNDCETNSETTPPYDGQYSVLGWPNDYESDDKNTIWEEKEVILSMMEAINTYEASSNGSVDGVVKTYDSIPMTGSDLPYTASPFARVASSCDTIEKLSPYLGLRIANVIGVGDSNCTSNDAYAIGYMDAVNMISATSDYNKLKNAIKSKGTNHNFADQVINYLTCDSSVKPTSATESGNYYNSFEIIRGGSGNYYGNDRHHPIFWVQSGSNDYTYSYAYATPKSSDDMSPVSLVPTQLWKFDGTNNPYKDLFTGESSTDDSILSYSFTPTITDTNKSGSVTGVSQEFVYTANTSDFLDSSDEEYSDYTNEELFYVVNSIGKSNNIRSQIRAFKNGDVKYKDYAIKGEDEDNLLKSFFNRRYKLMDDDAYYRTYNGYVSYAAPMSEIDDEYAADHLCEYASEKEDITYDDQWFRASSGLHTKYLQSAKDNKTNDSDNVVIMELPVTINSSDFSLFGTKLYFQQNNIGDVDDTDESSNSKLRNKCKAYLVLTSMISGIKRYTDGLFSDATNTSVIQNVQPCYIYFLGALLWRKRYYDSEGAEPLYMNGYKNIPSADASFIRKSDNHFYIGTGTETKTTWLTIDDYLTDYDSIDISVKNKLVNLFENFANGSDFKTILHNCELSKTDSDDSWNDLREKWTNSTFDTTSPSQWTKVFNNIFGKYSSIVVPNNKSGLRLLFSEQNEAMDALKNVFGLNGGFVIGRGTANRVGGGSNEVVVTSEQMKGYLNGFEKRIKDLTVTSSANKEEKSNTISEECDRNLAISMYYSLKQLWDAWLISAKRDQFTIENFFNKYFIFMDSFYVNTYNAIKLNCQSILDCYNTEDISVLTFLTTIAKDERCSFYSIPNFIDTNNMSGGLSTVKVYNKNYKDNMGVKMDNLKKVFTPLTFNEMGVPQANNVFVFIYTHEYSGNASESNGKKYDSYSMNNRDTWPGALSCKQIQDSASEDDELVVGRSSYTMPCFGVTVNRGNNYIFKGINVHMESPKITDVSAQTMEDIYIRNGRDGGKRVYFHGQDIYKIYSQYSYNCSVEMIGCAQIQPLMYFQLLNMPMWRGTYMIYKVIHSITPGMMKTTFDGIKMSRHQTPISTGYYTEAKSLAQKGEDTTESSSNSSEVSGGNSCDTSVGYGLWAVGGNAMIKNIFGNYTGYRDGNNFGEKRTSSNGGTYHHAGDDLACKEGTELLAPWDGYVYLVKPWDGKSAAGNYIVFVDNNNRYAVVYMHCKQIDLKKNDKVTFGTKIALAGKTGRATGPHLHLELHEMNSNGGVGLGKLKRDGNTNSTHINPSTNHGYIGSVDSDS